MAIRPADPLLGGTRLLLVLVTILFALGAVVAVIAIGPIWMFGDRVIAWLAATGGATPLPHQGLVALTLLLCVFIAEDLLSIVFLRRLIAIIDTVGRGSPFSRENAHRLRAMGWMVLAMQAIIIAVMTITPWLRRALGNPHFFLPCPLAGLITALLLFILARVFDHGSQLAEDVEGTI